MPRAGYTWQLVTINTHGSWLHGDPRGFRVRAHRIHSSGDYRNPPPEHEHQGLRAFHVARSRLPVKIPRNLRPIIGAALINHFRERFKLLAVSVSSNHAHLVVELPNDYARRKRIVGDAKRRSSRAVRKWLAGSVWSAGASCAPKENRHALATAINYVRDRQGGGSWTWTVRDADGEYR